MIAVFGALFPWTLSEERLYIFIFLGTDHEFGGNKSESPCSGVSQDSASIAFSIGVELVEWVTIARGFEAWGAIWRKGAAGRGEINN
jgi:hypothetical protein